MKFERLGGVVVVTPDPDFGTGRGFWPDADLKAEMSEDPIAFILDLGRVRDANRGMVLWINEAGRFLGNAHRTLLIMHVPMNLMAGYLTIGDENFPLSEQWICVADLEAAMTRVAAQHGHQHLPGTWAGKAWGQGLTRWTMIQLSTPPEGRPVPKPHHFNAHASGIAIDVRKLPEVSSMTFSWIAGVLETCSSLGIELVVICDDPKALWVFKVAAFDLTCRIVETWDDIVPAS